MRNNEMKRRNRWLSLLLVAILVISMLVPVTAFAEENDDSEYTIILHANRPNKVFHIYDWESGKSEYKAEMTEKYYGSSDESFSFSQPYEEENTYPAGYSDWSDGYEFVGWAKSASGSVISKKIEDEDDYYDIYVAAKDLNANGTTHLYAQWKKTSYVVTFDAGKQGYFTGGRYDSKAGKYVRQKYQKECNSYYMDGSAEDRLCEPWPIRTYSPAQRLSPQQGHSQSYNVAHCSLRYRHRL